MFADKDSLKIDSEPSPENICSGQDYGVRQRDSFSSMTARSSPVTQCYFWKFEDLDVKHRHGPASDYICDFYP